MVGEWRQGVKRIGYGNDGAEGGRYGYFIAKGSIFMNEFGPMKYVV